ENEHVVELALQCVTDADVVAADVPEVVVVDDERGPRKLVAHGGHGDVRRRVVDDDHFIVRVIEVREAVQAGDDVFDAVPRQNDHGYARPTLSTGHEIP